MLRGLVFVLPFLLGLWAERSIRRARPLWLAGLAWLPIGRRRRVVLSESLRRELRRREERTYREAAVGEADFSRLPLTRLAGSLRVAPEGDVAVLTSPRCSGLARIDLRLAGDAVLLRARCLPVPLSLVLWSASLLLVGRGSPWVLGLALGIPLFTAARSIRQLRPEVREAMDAIARELSGPADGP